MKNMKAQIWSMDFVVSFLIFFVTLSMLFFAWNYTNYKSTEQIQLNNLYGLSLTITDSLIRIPGFPSDWSPGNVMSIGLVDDEYHMNETKISMFLAMNYGNARQILLEGRYNFYFNMNYLNGSQIMVGGVNATKGTYPDSSSSMVVPAKRYAVYNGNIAEIDFILWI
jgi:hypothetical protein